jgi:Fe-S-cluster containining protein
MQFRPAYYYTVNLSRVLKNVNKQQFFQIHEGVEYYISQYEKGKREYNGISAAASFQDTIQETIDKESKNNGRGEIRCGKGCSFCCHYHVDITDDEADLLIQFSKENNIKIDKPHLEKQKDKNVDNWDDLKYAERRCVFLNTDGSCRVYQRRPVSCRALQVITDPKLCSTEFKSQNVGALSILDVDMMATGIINATRMDSMAKLLIEKINKNEYKEESILRSKAK